MPESVWPTSPRRATSLGRRPGGADRGAVGYPVPVRRVERPSGAGPSGVDREDDPSGGRFLVRMAAASFEFDDFAARQVALESPRTVPRPR